MLRNTEIKIVSADIDTRQEIINEFKERSNHLNLCAYLQPIRDEGYTYVRDHNLSYIGYDRDMKRDCHQDIENIVDILNQYKAKKPKASFDIEIKFKIEIGRAGYLQDIEITETISMSDEKEVKFKDIQLFNLTDFQTFDI